VNQSGGSGLQAATVTRGRTVQLLPQKGRRAGRSTRTGRVRPAAASFGSPGTGRGEQLLPVAQRPRPAADTVSLLQWVAATRGLAAAMARAERLRSVRSGT